MLPAPVTNVMTSSLRCLIGLNTRTGSSEVNCEPEAINVGVKILNGAWTLASDERASNVETWAGCFGGGAWRCVPGGVTSPSKPAPTTRTVSGLPDCWAYAEISGDIGAIVVCGPSDCASVFAASLARGCTVS